MQKRDSDRDYRPPSDSARTRQKRGSEGQEGGELRWARKERRGEGTGEGKKEGKKHLSARRWSCWMRSALRLPTEAAWVPARSMSLQKKKKKRKITDHKFLGKHLLAIFLFRIFFFDVVDDHKIPVTCNAGFKRLYKKGESR